MGVEGVEVRSLANRVVREALAPSGIDLVASCGVETYDARAPSVARSSALMPKARGVVVVASAGRGLWRAFRAYMREDASRWDREHPLDDYAAEHLARAGDALAERGIAHRRFEPTIYADPALDFRALGELVGLGSLGPFGMLIHKEHGAWWALRGAFFVDAEVDPPCALPRPCDGCAAPCLSGKGRLEVVDASPEVRARCVVGQGSRYDDEQIAYHYDREATRTRLRHLDVHRRE